MCDQILPQADCFWLPIASITFKVTPAMLDAVKANHDVLTGQEGGSKNLLEESNLLVDAVCKHTLVFRGVGCALPPPHVRNLSAQAVREVWDRPEEE